MMSQLPPSDVSHAHGQITRPPQNEATIFVVDDDLDMRESLELLLQTLGYRVAAFPSARTFREVFPPETPGCLLLDIRMPGQSGLELYESLLKDGVRIPAIFITAHADVTTAVAAMKTGAVEFLEKPFARVTLIDRIEKALQLDREWRSREQEFRILDERISRLSRRDHETLQMLLAGESNKRMAAQLNISERAVEMRRASLMRRLQVRSLAEVLELAISHRVLAEVRHARVPGMT